MVPASVVHLYLIGKPPGETAFAVSCTCGAPPSAQAVTMFESAVKLSESGALTAETTFVFWANACVVNIEAARAIGATYPASRKIFLNICTPYVWTIGLKKAPIGPYFHYIGMWLADPS